MGWFRSSTQPEGDPILTFEERLAAIGPGVPGRCPSCDGLGYIDNLDIGHRFQIQHCKDCGHRWEYLFDADGTVVGLTELDEGGQPVARMRIRARGATPPKPATSPAEVATPPVADAVADGVIDVTADEVDVARGGATDVIDLREPTTEPLAADHLSPAEWLRHALRR